MTARTKTPQAPPHSLEAERSTLGAILVNPDAYDAVAAEFAGLDDTGLFHDPACAEVWQLMRAARAKGQPVDIVCLCQTTIAQPGSDVTASFLAGLASAVPTSANAVHYARAIVEKFRLRQLRKAGQRLFHDSAKPEADAQAIMLALAGDVAQLSRAGSTGIVNAADGIEAAVAQIINLYETQSTGGLLTGFNNLDRVLSGLGAGTVCVIAARPSVGKTALSLNIATNTAKAGHNVLIFSLEMSPDALIQRAVYAASGLEKDRIIAGHYSRDELAARMQAATTQNHFSRIHIDGSRRLTHFDLTTKARAFKRERPLDLIIIDYLQLLTPVNPKSTREAQVSEASREIKILSEQAGCPVIVLSQLNRAAEHDGEPNLSHLRESGAIEQDADIAILLSRAEGSVIRANIAKNRNGATGVAGLAFDKATQTFRDWVGDIGTPGQQQARAGFRKTAAPAIEQTYTDGDDDAF